MLGTVVTSLLYFHFSKKILIVSFGVMEVKICSLSDSSELARVNKHVINCPHIGHLHLQHLKWPFKGIA